METSYSLPTTSPPLLASSLQYSPRKRSRRRSKDKIRELHLSHLSPQQSLSPPNDPELDLHAWGLGDLKKDLAHLYSIANKCVEGFPRRSTISTTAIPLLGDQLQKWKIKRIKSHLISSWNVTISKILQGEYTFHIWLEAIQTKKRIIRLEALRRVDELEALIAFHEYRLDEIDDRMDECKTLAVMLKKQCNILSAMKLFIEEQIVRSPPPMEPIDDSSEEEIVFKGYSFDSGRAVRPSDIVSAQNELFHLSMSKNHSRTRQSSSASAFSDNEMSIDTEISEKLALSIDLVNRCSNLQEHIRQNQQKEMAILSIIWRCRSMLRHLCDFSSNPHDAVTFPSEFTNVNNGSVHGSGIGESTINRESRELSRSGSFSSDNNSLLFAKSSRKSILKRTREIISLMEVLTEQEANSKGYLQKLSIYKQELSEIKFKLEKCLPANSKWELIDIPSVSLACEIVMGCHEPISPNLSPSIEKYTPLPSQFPSVQGLFENDELNFNNFLKSLPPCSHLYAKDLSSCVLKILLEALRSSSLGVDTLNSEIGIYLKQQGLPAPWVSPTLGKVRSQSVDFDLSDTPYPPDISCGCGLLVHFPESSSLVEFQVGIQNVCAIYSTSFLYRNIFSALALTHYLEESFSTMLPLFVLNRTEVAEASFILLTSDRLDCILKSFLDDNLALYPTFQFDYLPLPYKIDLRKLPSLGKMDKLRLFCSLRCSNNIVSEFFASEEESSNVFFNGIARAINSWNPDAAKDLVLAGAKLLLTNPQHASQGDPNVTSFKQTEIQLAPLEDLVGVVSRYDLSVNRQHSQSELFIPLAAIRILLVAVNKQTFHRYLECCEQLAHWIHLSSIVTLQLFRSARISRPSSSASLCGMKDELTDSMVDCDFQILPPPFDDPIPKRVPLVGSVTVSCRTELYHDLLHIHRFSSRPSRLQFRDLNNFRSSIEMFEQSLENTIRLLYFLCSVVEELLADWTSWSPPYVPLETLSLTKRQYSVLFSMRNDIRLSILQYILGLDERWSLEATVASCTFVKKCIEYHYRDLVNLTVPSLLRISSNKSRIFPSSTVNLLALALPDDVLSLNCQILYSLAEDGVGISFLRSLLQDSHQHILLFLQDSYGYLFGAFLSFVPHQLSTILPEKSFLFRALPDFKIFPLTSREEAYAPWLSSSGIHIGLLPCLSSSSPSSTASAILYLDPSFSFGHTSLPDPAMTHETLSLGEEFKCHLFEVWAFTGA